MSISRFRRAVVSSAWALLLSAVAIVPASAASRIQVSHVRSVDAVITRTLRHGSVASATFRELLDALERSDIVVHIERGQPGTGTTGSTRFVTTAGGTRYVRITLDVADASGASVALLGHELRHAVEIAEAPWVVDQATCRELYVEIGHRSCRRPGWCFETAAAVAAGRQVLSELSARSLSSW